MTFVPGVGADQALRMGTQKLVLAGEVIEMIWKRFPSPLSALFATIVIVRTSIGIAVADPTGLWLARDGAHVEITPCGSELCGVLVSASSPIDPATGRPWVDKNNTDPNLRYRPLVGVQCLWQCDPTASVSGQDAFTTGTTVKPTPGILTSSMHEPFASKAACYLFCAAVRT